MSNNDNESDVEYSETEECGYDDYYNPCDDADGESMNQKKCDPEHFEFECLTVDQVSWKELYKLTIETQICFFRWIGY